MSSSNFSFKSLIGPITCINVKYRIFLARSLLGQNNFFCRSNICFYGPENPYSTLNLLRFSSHLKYYVTLCVRHDRLRFNQEARTDLNHKWNAEVVYIFDVIWFLFFVIYFSWR